MPDKPNILVLVVDCLRADKVFGAGRGCKTPFLDAWRARGVSFTQCISTATTTTPSIAAQLTGQFPAFNGVRSHSGYKLNPSTTPLAQYLKDAGYRTLARVTGPISPEVGLDRGFDDYRWRKRRDYAFGLWGEQLLDELRGLGGKAPWFLFLHLFELHKPRQILPQFNRAEFGVNFYERSLSSLDGTLGKIIETAGPDAVVFLTGDHGEKLLPSAFRDHIYELSRPIRKPLRKLIGKLSRNPVSDAFYETGHGFHVYDELARVPLVVVGPALPVNTTVQQQVRHVDIAPTVLEIAGASPASLSMNGRSLLPLVRGEEAEDRLAYCEAVGAALPNAKSWLVGIRSPQYKYCYRPFADRPFEELYDLRADPSEQTNLAPGQPQLCAEWKAKLQTLSQEFEAQPILQGQKMTEAEQQILEERLKDLGYIE